jgi:hypothetical protein
MRCRAGRAGCRGNDRPTRPAFRLLDRSEFSVNDPDRQVSKEGRTLPRRPPGANTQLCRSPSSENDQGNMNLASKTDPVASTRPSSVAAIHRSAACSIRYKTRNQKESPAPRTARFMESVV